MRKLKIRFIDDQAHLNDTKRLAGRITNQQLICKADSAPPNLNDLDKIIRHAADLFLVDYELSLKQPTGKASYKGTTLATEIRARRPDFPVVIITRESILKKLDRQTRYELIHKMKLCDELIRKDQVVDDLENMRYLLISLAEGYRILRSAKNKNWTTLTKALDAQADEESLLNQTSPPLEAGSWIVTAAANWIRGTVLEYPGILFDSIHAATHLGITEDSFNNQRLQKLIQPAKYKGIFAPKFGLWWKGRLFKLMSEFIQESGVEGSLDHAFRKAFKNKYSVTLKPATCIWDGTSPADWVCHLLRKPAKIKNSLRYYPDNRPGIMDAARVSFRAIRESSEFDDDLLDAEGRRLLKSIKKLPDPLDS